MEILYNEPMKRHTTFRTGGCASVLYKISSEEELKDVILKCKEDEMPYYIMGNGSNVLVSDKGYKGAVIQIYSGFSDIKVDGEYIRVKAGALLSKIASVARDNSLTGFEFASGIPGTFGGACAMNAGAYGGEIKDVVQEVQLLIDGEVITLTNEMMEFGYRHSIIQDGDAVVLGGLIKLEKGDKEAISERMATLNQMRKDKQPLEYPSAGSAFKRPLNNFAAKLINDCGLVGYRVGGAMVSEKHCGFVINYDNATSCDIYQLMKDVRDKVYKDSGIMLEPEVKFLGEFE